IAFIHSSKWILAQETDNKDSIERRDVCKEWPINHASSECRDLHSDGHGRYVMVVM
ncbi:hypothetical protein DPMN_063112, partial [Dreissena polymorpha]